MSTTLHEPEIAAPREPDLNRRGLLGGSGLGTAATVAIGAGLATAALSATTPPRRRR